jgi:hypothetical protein
MALKMPSWNADYPAQRGVAFFLAMGVFLAYEWFESYREVAVDGWELLTLGVSLIIVAIYPKFIGSFVVGRGCLLLLLLANATIFVWWILERGFRDTWVDIGGIGLRFIAYGLVVFLLFKMCTNKPSAPDGPKAGR